ncbi:hypothetical protein HMPREF1862_01295 [Varibaculum cambriense]|uniref:Uncharacterized protein n=1 Tax=Varibaculum cambriense TaxID=184870 RepID=A0AB34WYJ9_9ACTO|nr:hypothetical protein HMPREF1862_01295 [Varibaculum cambriense]
MLKVYAGAFNWVAVLGFWEILQEGACGQSRLLVKSILIPQETG